METACPQAVSRFIYRFNGVRARHLQRRGSLPFTRDSQFAVEEFGGGAVGADPIAPAEQVVNFVGDDERDLLGAQFFGQIGGLLEGQHGERLHF